MARVLMLALLVSSWLVPHRAWADDGVPAQQASLDGKPRVPGIGVFSDLEWRGFYLARHFSHGPAFAAGIIGLGGRLRLGIGGFSRPGPLNPSRFDVEPADAQSYRGQRELSLRSDGALIGLHAAWVFDFPAFDDVTVSVPVTIGQAAFGFYLAGEDRNTPDNRRVSEWENELFEGRDAGIGLGIDAGIRLSWKAEPWLRPYVTTSWFTTVGYDSYVANDYGGPSLGVGVEVGKGL